MRFWRGAGSWLLVVALLFVAGSAWAQDAAVIEGQVVNGTPGAPEVGSGLPVTLHVFQGGTEVSTLDTLTGDAGRFRFEDLDPASDLEYWPEAVYLDVPYGPAEPLRFGAGETALEATLTVYETTSDESAVKLSSVHFIAQSFSQVLRISEIHLFGNSGDRTYVGHVDDSVADRAVTAFIPLPSGAVGLAFDVDNAEERFISTDQGVYDTEPIQPGEEVSLVFFSYHLMVGGEDVRLERQFAYPVDALSGLVAQPGLELRSDSLEAMGPQVFQDQQYLLYATGQVPAGAAIVMDLIPGQVDASQAMPGGVTGGGEETTLGPTSSSQGLLGVLGAVLAGLVVLGAVLYPLVGRREEPVRVRAAEIAAHPGASRLLDELADLEEGYEAGSVDQAHYESARAMKLREIQALWS